MQHAAQNRWAFPALIAGAAAIGVAPIFVRLSAVGPSATAFYRMLLALPLLWCWMHLENLRQERRQPVTRPLAVSRRSGNFWLLGLAGFFFAGDLAFWHWSVQLTTVANSTLLTNFAPLFVIAGAKYLFAERTGGFVIIGMTLAMIGGALLVGSSFQVQPEHVTGDLLALVTALFYAGYFLTIKHLRVFFSTPQLMLGSGIFSCLLLGLIAWVSEESFQVDHPNGWLVLIGLALISHVGGQSLIAFSLAHLPVSASSVSLLLQPVVAAFLAWTLLSEPLTPLQIIGGAVVIAGIAMARFERST